MFQAFLQVWQNPYVRVLVVLSLLYLAYRLLVRLWPALSVLFMALAIAYLVHPLVLFLEGRRLPRFLGVLLVYLTLALFAGLVSLLATQTVVALSGLVAELPSWVRPLVDWISGLPERLKSAELPPLWEGALEEVERALQGFLQEVLQNVVGTLASLFQRGGALLGFFVSLLGGVFQVAISLVLSVYFLYDLPRIGRAALLVLPEPYQPLVAELARKLDRTVGGYVRGQLLIALIVGFLTGFGFWAIGLPLAASLGFLAGVFNLVPFVGVYISGALAILLAASLGWEKVLLTLGVILGVNQLEAYVLAPLIVGRATRLHPVTAIAAILTGASLFGLWGALLGVPAAAFLKVLLEEYYRRSAFYRQG